MVPATLRGAHRPRPHGHVPRPSRPLARLLAAGAAGVVLLLLLRLPAGPLPGGRGDGCPAPASACMASGVAPQVVASSRRNVLLGTLGLGLSLAPSAEPGRAVGPAAGPGQPWRQEIPETLQVLRNLQSKWPDLEEQGQLGGGRIRKVLDYTLVENITVSVPSGEPVGAAFRNRRVTSVMRPELGWREKDQVVAVNGAPVASPEAMRQLMEQAQSANKPLQLSVARRKQSPIDGIEEDLVQAYMKLDGRELPDIDEVVSHLNAARALAFGASSSGRSSSEMLGELRAEIDALVPELELIVKAMG
mmetsp:Transcript_46042/g.128070  ORF Transcript_46042/g.128070 Transcript_46042/m.128070 type:complete len:304 (-) Transcript_46042:123-1034(-)|eukprot:CAMPEP_0179131006 /NCGR_PEP_ID=MMETSP0796-20121207/62216_1 /TAXON_ID=73915 /ORGANISM="Pyrodinium bahamense, Strain pbaha01" /LENGTH=303 /DNA_ID=CAMNT_0020829921 /DNA_START=77 /DNA_END=988 /DNA_ORIENTATION=-